MFKGGDQITSLSRFFIKEEKKMTWFLIGLFAGMVVVPLGQAAYKKYVLPKLE
jgi:hypothetical protein